ncbi:MAG: clan AA aspartic protease [Rhizobiales bacterium]|nr:clan AA aspartic protease [Hyphomicrobiales bacterium]
MLARASVNGVDGRFIIDTGASYVSLTEGFARKTGVDLANAPVVQTLTANGLTDRKLTTAEVIQIGPIKARLVSVAVGGNLGDEIDGLLGMSFLARFSVTLTPGRLEISAHK